MALRLRLDNTEYIIVNPEDVPRGRYGPGGRRDATYPLYVFGFGAYGDVHVLVWGAPGVRGIEGALELAAEWLADNAPGHLIDNEEIGRLYEEAKEEDPEGDEESWQETATTDLTYTESGYIPSWEWTVDELHPDNPLYRAAYTASRAGNQLEDLPRWPHDRPLTTRWTKWSNSLRPTSRTALHERTRRTSLRTKRTR